MIPPQVVVKNNGFKLNIDSMNKRLENELMDNEIQNPRFADTF